MKVTIYCLYILIIMVSISCFNKRNQAQNSDEKFTSQKSVTLPETFYKRMEGNTGNKYDIVMNLVRVDTAIKGFYYYMSRGEPIPFSLKSNIDNNGNILIEEDKGFDKDYNSVITGIFKGKFISDSEFTGTWEQPGSDKTLSFNLTEKYPEGTAQFDITNYSKKVSQNDSTHNGFAQIQIFFPSLKNYSNKKIQAMINSYLQSVLLENVPGDGNIKKYEGYDAMISDFFKRYYDAIAESKKMGLPRDIYFRDYFLIDIINNSDNIISFRQTTSTYEGGAHPNTFFNYKNYDLKTGKEITLSDIFTRNYLPVLTKIAEIKFRKYYKVLTDENLEQAGFWFKNGVFRLNSNFTFNEYGIIFQFNTYEVAAYAMGAPKLVIPYAEIESIIKPDGLLGKFIKQP